MKKPADAGFFMCARQCLFCVGAALAANIFIKQRLFAAKAAPTKSRVVKDVFFSAQEQLVGRIVAFFLEGIAN